MTIRRAAQPPAGMALLEEAVDHADAMRVTLRLEDDHAWVFDLSKASGPDPLRREICRAMLAWSSTQHGVRRSSTARGKYLSLSIFLRWLAKFGADDDLGVVESCEQITGFHLVHFREYLSMNYGAHSVNQYFGDTCRLMEFLPVSDAVLWQARKRRGVQTPPPSRPSRYTSDEFIAIRRAARSAVREAHRRIRASYEEALVGDRPDSTPTQRALYEVLTTGEAQSRAGWRALGCWRNTHGSRTSAHLLLFPDRDEILAAATLIACKRGLNLSAIRTLNVPTPLDDELIQVDVDKPRRGPTARFWAEIVDDNGEDRRAAAMFRMIGEMTDPLREYLRHVDAPTERLLCHWGRDGAPKASFFTSGVPAWHPFGEPVSFGRLRRSVPIAGVGREPTHHNTATHLHYIRTDAEALVEHQHQASMGMEAAMARARDELAMIWVPDEQTSHNNDALIANCADPEHHPSTGLPCVSGYFSFLDCLNCENAVTVNRLLPRQMAALSVLERLADVAGDGWSAPHSNRILLLKALIERSTAHEQELALKEVDQFRPLIVAALRNEIPSEYEHFLQ